MSSSKTRIDGWGADLLPSARPGVPREKPPAPIDGAPGLIQRQTPRVRVFKRQGAHTLTPVFGTSVPPRGLSGLVRGAAYQHPDHKARRWMMLLLADRIDIIEGFFERHRGARNLILLGSAVWLYRASMNSRRPRRRFRLLRA